MPRSGRWLSTSSIVLRRTERGCRVDGRPERDRATSAGRSRLTLGWSGMGHAAPVSRPFSSPNAGCRFVDSISQAQDAGSHCLAVSTVAKLIFSLRGAAQRLVVLINVAN